MWVWKKWHGSCVILRCASDKVCVHIMCVPLWNVPQSSLTGGHRLLVHQETLRCCHCFLCISAIHSILKSYIRSNNELVGCVFVIWKILIVKLCLSWAWRCFNPRTQGAEAFRSLWVQGSFTVFHYSVALYCGPLLLLFCACHSQAWP